MRGAASGVLRAVGASGLSMGVRYAKAEAFLVRVVAPRDAVLGSIVVLRRGEVEVAHRLLGCVRWRGQRWVVTRGDGNGFVDPPWLCVEGLEVAEALAMQVEGAWVSLDGVGERLRGGLFVVLGWGLIVWRRLRGRSLYGG